MNYSFNIRLLDSEEAFKVYEECGFRDFPWNEAKPLHEVRRLLSLGSYFCYASRENGITDVYAFFFRTEKDGQSLLILDYYAVRPELRDKGIGTAFMRSLLERLEQDFIDPVMFLESENPRALTGEARSTAEKRLGFYNGCGLHATGVYTLLFGVDYIMYSSRMLDDSTVYEYVSLIYDRLLTRARAMAFVRIEDSDAFYFRKFYPEDEPELNRVYDHARKYMSENGNPTQWDETYPASESIHYDIEHGCGYAAVQNGRVCGAFAFIIGEDPTYIKIYDGEWLNDSLYGTEWLNDSLYGTIHRIASDGTVRGLLEKVVAYCEALSDNLRCDTHNDNVIMQHVLEKNGFIKCGTILLENGDPRIAYHRYKDRHYGEN